MTEEDDFSEEELENFEEKTEEEKIETIKRLHKKLAERDGDMLEDFNVQGEITARVIDEDGEEKHVQKEEININEVN